MNSANGIVIATVAIQSTGRLKPWQVATAKQMMLEAYRSQHAEMNREMRA
ncbi:helix-turn-helix domain-containing protein [Pseudomonas putida]|jgi:hypothetical protein|nr:hypothetical protein SAMN05216307_2760 [Pseudomonas putida]SMQ00444.1 hypothetical protein SAMN05216380_1244 [Pseudomonas putida]VEE40624.1 helix-turn-helix domain-containing protein [Pseudomonas putida]VTQ37610.1 helix-turn-helix domain-containing protein [Pseudomonas putida]